MALTDSLISHWKLDETSGNATDAHGSNTLTDNNTVTTAAGKIGTARQFTAANSESLSHADNADLSLGTDTPFTWALWVYPDTITGVHTLVAKWGGAGSAEVREYHLQIIFNATANYVQFSIGNGASSVTLQTFPNAVLTVGAWNFIVAWHDEVANTVNIQVNNGTVYSGSWSGGTFDGTGTMALGRNGSFGSQYFDGRLDSVSFWKRVLTSGEKTTLYNGGAGLDYPFTTGTTVTAPAGAVTIAGLAPTLTVAVTAPVGTETIAGLAPTLTVAVSPSVGTETIAGLTPTLSVAVLPAAGAETIDGLAPSLTLTVGPSVGTITVAGLVPTPTVSVDAGVGSVTVAGLAPSLGVALLPAVGLVTVAVLVPTISGAVVIPPPITVDVLDFTHTVTDTIDFTHTLTDALDFVQE